jgi:hypothetical protein
MELREKVLAMLAGLTIRAIFIQSPRTKLPAIGITFLVAAGVYLAVRLFMIGL